MNSTDENECWINFEAAKSRPLWPAAKLPVYDPISDSEEHGLALYKGSCRMSVETAWISIASFSS